MTPILYQPPEAHHHHLPLPNTVRTGTIAYCPGCGNYLRAENPEGYGNHWGWISERRAKRLVEKGKAREK